MSRTVPAARAGPGTPTAARPRSSLVDLVPVRPSILRLTGISLKDYVSPDDQFDSNILAQVKDVRLEDIPASEELSYHATPAIFTGLADWPLRCNIKCFMCDCSFDDRPKFVPYEAREPPSGLELHLYKIDDVRVITCTFNCAELFIERFVRLSDERERMHALLCLAYFMFTGVRKTRILAAPSKYRRREYGGTWDNDTFRRELRALDTTHGPRDHTPGSVVQDRFRTAAAAPDRAASKTVNIWTVCRAAKALSDDAAKALSDDAAKTLSDDAAKTLSDDAAKTLSEDVATRPESGDPSADAPSAAGAPDKVDEECKEEATPTKKAAEECKEVAEKADEECKEEAEKAEVPSPRDNFLDDLLEDMLGNLLV
jgi:hypothetical protein